MQQLVICTHFLDHMCNLMAALQASLTGQLVCWWPVNSVMPALHPKPPSPRQSCMGSMCARALPPSLSLLSPQAVSMDVSQPAPLQPNWQTQCHPFRSKVHLPFPLHNPGQPSARQSTQNRGLIVHGQLQSHTLTFHLPTYKMFSHLSAHRCSQHPERWASLGTAILWEATETQRRKDLLRLHS